MTGLLEPPNLHEGSAIAVVAPSGPFDREHFAAGLARLRRRYVVRVDDGVYARDGYLAGSDERRARELTDALADTSVRAIVCARGGYGATRLLPALDPALVRANPKLLVGFSDVTALHALWARAGVRSLHATMVAGLGRADDAQVDRVIRAMEGEPPSRIEGLRSLTRGRASGALVGGNLAVLAALIGTPYAPPLDAAVLFLEDIGERPYRVDRMLTQMGHAGWFERVSAILVGRFTECDAGADGVTVDDVVRERLGHLRVPVLADVPAGHVQDNLPLRLGGRITVDAGGGFAAYEP